MTYPIDQTSDPGFSRLTVLVKQYPELRKVASASNLDTVEFEKLSNSQFAWAGVRRFPIHNKGHVALSYGYCKVAQENIPPSVLVMLEKAAKFHGLNLATIFPEREKIANDTAYYLLPDKRRFRVTGANDIPAIERAYHEKYAQLTPDERASAGVRLVSVARQHNVTLYPSTHKLAGFTATDLNKAADWIEARGKASVKVGSVKFQGIYNSLAEGLRDLTSRVLVDRPEQVKLAATINTLDKEAGITAFYGHYLLDPLQTVFNTDKLAQELTKIGSVVYDKTSLEQVPIKFWEDVLGADITKEIAPNGEVDVDMLTAVLPTLPSDIKATVDKQLTPYLG